VQATVLFSDIVNSTERVAEEGDRAWRDLLDRYELLVRRRLDEFHGRLIQFLGDGTLATFENAAEAIGFARAIRVAARELGFELRIGLHTGEFDVRGHDIRGLAVHIAARIEASAGADEILVSPSVMHSISGSGVRVADRGVHELRGVPGEWRLHEVI
jgi:class 3 adenylate cyclase